MVVTHIEHTVCPAFSDQSSLDDIAAAVFGPDEIAVLVIVKNRFRAHFAAPGIFDGSEFFAVVIEIHSLLQRLVNYLSLCDLAHLRAD